jgi:hypothetical protein
MKRLLEKLEAIWVAAAFAEAGEWKYAREVLEKRRKHREKDARQKQTRSRLRT